MATETVDTAIPAAGIELAGGDRAAALALFVQLDQRLETLLEGCSATDRWLDARGHECTETDAGNGHSFDIAANARPARRVFSRLTGRETDWGPG